MSILDPSSASSVTPFQRAGRRLRHPGLDAYWTAVRTRTFAFSTAVDTAAICGQGERNTADDPDLEAARLDR